MTRCAGAVLSTILAAAAYAQSRPDFTGTWKLNVAKSDFGRGSSMRELVVKVERLRYRVEIYTFRDRRRGNRIADPGLEVPIDGRPHDRPNGQGRVTFRWDGAVLAGEHSSDAGWQAKIRVQAADNDPKIMIREVAISGGDGDRKRREVYERQ